MRAIPLPPDIPTAGPAVFCLTEELLMIFWTLIKPYPQLWHGICNSYFELIIFGGFLGLNMIVSMARESSADFFVLLWALVFDDLCVHLQKKVRYKAYD